MLHDCGVYVAASLALVAGIGGIDEVFAIVREAMPDESVTVIDNVAYSLMQRSKVHCK